ncbi:MAG: type II toxin-antitoxin system RelE/ParE family toxin [Acidobacteria bacterium]|nr:type II toxin-antitoxin system RelE/ParE family toxin [Acidobacteriota bacterium]
MTAPRRLLLFKSRAFEKFASKEGIRDAVLCEAAARVNAGAIDADYGGGLAKQRIARPNQGKSKGYRSFIVFRRGERLFFVHGFSKSDQSNIDQRQERLLRILSRYLLGLSDNGLSSLVLKGEYVELVCNEQN